MYNDSCQDTAIFSNEAVPGCFSCLITILLLNYLLIVWGIDGQELTLVDQSSTVIMILLILWGTVSPEVPQSIQTICDTLNETFGVVLTVIDKSISHKEQISDFILSGVCLILMLLRV